MQTPLSRGWSPAPPSVFSGRLSPPPAVRILSSAGPSESERRLAVVRPTNGKVDVSGWNLGALEGLLPSARVEALYARANGLRNLDGIPALPQLRILDVSNNLLTDILLPKCPLRMLYLTANNIDDITIIPTIPTLEVLSISNNRLTTLDGMRDQPELRVFAVAGNSLHSFAGLPLFPKLESLRYHYNPVFQCEHYKKMAISACSTTLERLDGEALYGIRHDLSIRVCYAIRRGLVYADESQADAEALAFLRAETDALLPDCKVETYNLAGEAIEGSSLVANVDIRGPDGSALLVPGSFIDADEALMHSGGILEYQWSRCHRGGDFEPISGQTGPSYTATLDDVGCAIMLTVTARLRDGTEYTAPTLISDDILAAPPGLRSLRLEGKPLEGSEVSAVADYVGGREGESVVRWFVRREGAEAADALELVSEGGSSLTLGLAHIGATVVLQYTPVRDDGEAGETVVAELGIVQAARPSVSDVAIGGSLMEGGIVYGLGRYFGGAEGASVYQWYRGDSTAGPFVPVPGARNQSYSPGLTDVGRVLRFEYTPVSTRGIVGTPAVAISTAVVPGEPTVRNVQVLGEPEECGSLTVVAEYFGGVEGKSEIQWARRSALPGPAADRWVDVHGASGARYHITKDDIMHYLRATYRPVRADGVVGTPLSQATEQPVHPCVPEMRDLRLVGKLLEGEQLRLQGLYQGGQEGQSKIVWERFNADGEVTTVATGVREYTPTVADIGYFIRARYTPVRLDGFEGAEIIVETTSAIPPAEPRVLGFELQGEPHQGVSLHAVSQYTGGVEGASRYRWLRVRTFPDGITTASEEVTGAVSAEYMLSAADVGCTIVVEYIPVRSDGVAGTGAIARTSGRVVAIKPAALNVTLAGSPVEGCVLAVAYDYVGGTEGNTQIVWMRSRSGTESERSDEVGRGRTYTLTIPDIGLHLRSVITPVRADGLAGEAVTVSLATPVAAAAPQVLGFAMPPVAQELVTLRPQGSYFGGLPGTQRVNWYRLRDGAAPLQVSSEREYTPEYEDIGYVLRFEWRPARSDGVLGERAVGETHPVLPGVPQLIPMKDVRSASRTPRPRRSDEQPALMIGRSDNNDLFVGAEYRGGIEGASRISWQRVGLDGVSRDIPGATGKVYTPVPSDTGFAIVCKYTPVRSDGLVGDTYVTEPTHPLQFSDICAIKNITMDGKFVEGEKINARCSGYDGKINYKWFRQGDDGFNQIPGADGATYAFSLDDVGVSLKVEATPVFGDMTGQTVSVVSQTIAAGQPELRMPQVLVKGDRSHFSRFTIDGQYFGGREGPSIITWCRSRGGAPYEVIPNVDTRSYQGNADDIDAVIKVEYVPVRNDGLRGAPVGKEIGPLAISPEIASMRDTQLAARESKYNVQLMNRVEDGVALAVPEPRQLLLNKDKIKLQLTPPSAKAKPKTILKEFYNERTRVYLNPISSTQFALVLSDHVTVTMEASTPQERDVIALLVRHYEEGARPQRTYKKEKSITLKQAAQAVRLAQAWARPATVTTARPSQRTLPLEVRRMVSTKSVTGRSAAGADAAAAAPPAAAAAAGSPIGSVKTLPATPR